MSSAPSDRRRFARAAVPIFYREARLFGPRQPARDLSRGGLRIDTDDALTVGKRLEIELFLPDGRSITCDVRVAWVKKMPQGSFAAFEAGLEFLDVAPEDEALLDQCLAHARTEPPPRDE